MQTLSIPFFGLETASMIKAEFTLTLDDFFEWQKISQPRRRVQAPMIVVLCGFFLIVIGYILARSHSECRAIGERLHSSGLLATA